MVALVLVILLMPVTLLLYNYHSIGGSIAFVAILTFGALAPMTV